MSLRAAWPPALIAAWAAASLVLPSGLPPGIVLLGLVFGSLLSLVAAGLVLVWRASGVVNFAQAALGVVGGALAVELVFTYDVPYVVAMAAGLIVAALVGVGVEGGVIRRFRYAPRLIVAVATIGLAQILEGLGLLIPNLIAGRPHAGAIPTPFDATFAVHPVVFDGNHVLVMVAAPLTIAGLAWFLRGSRHGVALRAASENRERAGLLGIPVGRLSMVAWVLAALLSAFAIMLRVPILGFASLASVSGGGSALLLRALAAALIGRMDNLGRTVGAALAIGVLEQGLAWNVNSTTFVDAILVAVILVALLLQRDVFSRVRHTAITTWRSVHAVRPVPRELADLPEVVWGRRTFGVLLAAVAVTLPLWATSSQELVVSVIVVYAIIALSLVVLTGWAGHISLGQFAFAGIGGAVTALLYGRHGWDLFVALAAGVAAAGLVALVIGLPALRVHGPFLAVTTLAFAVTAGAFLLEERYLPWLIEEQISRPALLGRLPLDRDWQMYLFVLAGFAFALWAVRNLRRTRTGRALLAVRDNDLAAAAAGLSPVRVKLSAFLISGGLAGFAGGLLVLLQNGLHNEEFTPEASLRLFSMAVIGGLGSVPGAVLGAVYVRSAELLLPPAWALLASGLGIVVLLLFLPEGLGGVLYRIRDRILRRVSARRGLLVPSLVADARVAEPEHVELDAALERLGAP